MNKEWVDLEWLEAQGADEEEVYYFVNRGHKDCGTIIKKYKPSVAKIVGRRCRWKMTRVDDFCRENGWKSHKPVERRPRRKFEDKEPGGNAFIFHF